MANHRQRPHTHWAKYALTGASVQSNAPACGRGFTEALTRDVAQVTCVRCVGIVRWLGLMPPTKERKGT